MYCKQLLNSLTKYKVNEQSFFYCIFLYLNLSCMYKVMHKVQIYKLRVVKIIAVNTLSDAMITIFSVY